MRGGMFLFPTYMDAADATEANDALRHVRPVAVPAHAVGAGFDPVALAQTLRAIPTAMYDEPTATVWFVSAALYLRSIDYRPLVPSAASDAGHPLPSWAQAVLQTGCLQGIVP